MHRPDGTGGPRPATVAAVGLACAWIAAGSAGLFAHPLRRVLVCCGLAWSILASSRSIKASTGRYIPAILATILAIVLLAHQSSVPNIISVAVIMTTLAWLMTEEGLVLAITATAISGFGIYRGLVTSVPWAWQLADQISKGIAMTAAILFSQPMDLGPTFVGLDVLVLMLLFWICLIIFSTKPQLGRLFYGLLGLLTGHMLYLAVMAYLPQWMEAIATPAGQTPSTLKGLLHKALPWNLPVLACLIQVVVATAMVRWTCIQSNIHIAGPRSLYRCLLFVIAAMLPITAFAWPSRPTLAGKRIVFYEKGFLNWLKPRHGQYGRLSSGMYGMLPDFVASLGADAIISPDLADKDLEGADAVVLIFPDEPWRPGQKERIWDYVRKGGTLLVMGEHTTIDPNGTNRFNEILEPTNIRVAFDSATFAVGGWLHSYEPIMHPITAGIKDDKNQFGVVIGASIQTRWPARPILLGKWGWSDIGDVGSSRAMMGDDRYNGGERLGDLCLAAEQPYGKGRVVVFGDTSGLTNGINTGCYVFNGKLFAYIAGQKTQAHPAWRQVLAIGLCILLLVGITRDVQGQLPVKAAIVFGFSWALSVHVTAQAWQVIPQSREQPPIRIAYIDSSHMHAYSNESWRPDGMGGLILTLMRDDYLVLDLPRISSQQLAGADLLVIVAPARRYTDKELAILSQFVSRGGCLIITVGYERLAQSKDLLRTFGFYIGQDPQYKTEPPALGHFKSPYLRSETKMAYVRFHAAWPLGCTDPNARVIAYGAEGRPVFMLRRFGSGKVAVVADTCFAMCKNLENEDGSPFEGMRENADFWRWFITVLQDKPMWIPQTLLPEQTSQEVQAQ